MWRNWDHKNSCTFFWLLDFKSAESVGLKGSSNLQALQKNLFRSRADDEAKSFYPPNFQAQRHQWYLSTLSSFEFLFQISLYNLLRLSLRDVIKIRIDTIKRAIPIHLSIQGLILLPFPAFKLNEIKKQGSIFCNIKPGSSMGTSFWREGKPPMIVDSIHTSYNLLPSSAFFICKSL